MSYELEFELQGLPRMANIASGKSHWRHALKESRHWKDLVKLFCAGRQPAEPLKRYTLHLVRHSSVEPDFDGLVRGFKHIVDGLKVAGIIADDRLSNSGAWHCGWVKSKPKAGKISVRVVEASIPISTSAALNTAESAEDVITNTEVADFIRNAFKQPKGNA